MQVQQQQWQTLLTLALAGIIVKLFLVIFYIVVVISIMGTYIIEYICMYGLLFGGLCRYVKYFLVLILHFESA